MTTDKTTDRQRQYAEEAAEWLMTLNSKHVSSDARKEFVNWLRESPAHIAAMLHISRVHGALVNFQNWADVTRSAGAESDTVIPFPALPLKHGLETQRSKRVWRWTTAVAASVALAGIVAAFMVYRMEGTAIRTSAGERSEVTLADGSVVEVASSTSLRVTLEERERHVVIERGQAYFHVHKDSARPFIVEASGVRIRAVGTAFNVNRSDDGVVVTVTEGKVTVSTTAKRNGGIRQQGAAGEVPIVLAANQQVTVSPAGSIGTVRQTDGEAAVTWATGQLDFDNQAIADVAQRFNAYNRVQIVIDDPLLSARRVTGAFRIVDPESFADFIQTTYPGAVVRHEGDRIIITADPSLNITPDAR